ENGLVGTLSSAGLPAPSIIVGEGPPLSWTGPSSGSPWSVAGPLPSFGKERLCPPSVITPPHCLSLLPATMLLRRVTFPPPPVPVTPPFTPFAPGSPVVLVPDPLPASPGGALSPVSFDATVAWVIVTVALASVAEM